MGNELKNSELEMLGNILYWESTPKEYCDLIYGIFERFEYTTERDKIKKLKDEAHKMLTEEKEEQVVIRCKNDNYDIAIESAFIGGESDKNWMSSMIGNYSYSNAKAIIDKIFDLIKENGDIAIEVNFT
jgi:hypothetical protein